jgi:hypothetical protein
MTKTKQEKDDLIGALVVFGGVFILMALIMKNVPDLSK